MAAKDAERREAVSRLGGYVSWARETDRTRRTAPARLAFERRFETEVDPDGTLDPIERTRLAVAARKAYYAELSAKGAAARRARAAERRGTPRHFAEITPDDAINIRLPRADILGPLTELGEACPWPWEPIQLKGAPMGQYRCSYCGAMVIAGVDHLDYRDADGGESA